MDGPAGAPGVQAGETACPTMGCSQGRRVRGHHKDTEELKDWVIW
jgi:hypothetical protein